MIPINSIMIPGQFQALCRDWAGSESCMLRAISSTNGLTTGTRCPLMDYNGHEDKMNRWYYTIWCDLAADVTHARRLAGEYHADYEALCEFETWADAQVDRLCESYNLEDF